MKHISLYKKLLTFLLIVLACYAGLAGYYMLASGAGIDFRINWNIFDSILMGPLYVVGLIGSLGMKFSSYIPWIRTEYSDGTVEYERDHDIIENLFASIVLPLLNYLVIGPLVIAAMIYYPIMVLIYLFGKIFPYLIIAFFVLTLILFFKCGKKLIIRENRLLSIPFVAILFVGVLWLLYYLWVPSSEESIGLINMTSIGVICVIINFFIYLSIWEKKKKEVPEDQSLPESQLELDGKEVTKISKAFIITYIGSFLFILGIYGFKAADSYSSDSNDVEEAAIIDTFGEYTVSGDNLNVRSGAGTSYSKIGVLSKGEKIQILDMAGNWAKINYKGSVGYVSMEFLLPEIDSKVVISPEKKKPIGDSDLDVVPPSGGKQALLSEIPEQTGVFSSLEFSTDKESRKRITPAERRTLKIDDISQYLSIALPTEQISSGIVIYQGSNGTIRTILNIMPDHAVFEYLVSYNEDNEVIACMEIGEIMYYAGDKMYTSFGGNKFTIHYNCCGIETVHTVYRITPGLEFVKD